MVSWGSSGQSILQLRADAREICNGFLESEPFTTEKDTVLAGGLDTLDQADSNVPDIDEANSRGIDLVLGGKEVVDELVGAQGRLISRRSTETWSERSDEEWWIYYERGLVCASRHPA